MKADYLQVTLIEHDRLGDGPEKTLAVYTTHGAGAKDLAAQLRPMPLNDTHAFRVLAAPDLEVAEKALRDAGLPVTD